MTDIIDETVIKGTCAGCGEEPNKEEGVFLELIEDKTGPKLAFICKKHRNEIVWDLNALRTQLIRLDKKSTKIVQAT